MNNDFRQRVFLPVIMPLGVILAFIGFAFMLSRVLLAVDEFASTAIALGLATYILAIAAVVSTKPRITSRALAVGVTLGVLGVVAAGGIAASVGMRELEHVEGEGAPPAGETGDVSSNAEPDKAGEAAAPAGKQLEFTAVDIEFESAPETTTAGKKNIVLINNGQAQHNVTIDGEVIVEADGGQTANAQIELEPGTYEFICSVPGHESNMKGEITVE